MSAPNTIKVKFWTYVQSNGDGSCHVRYYATEADAYAYEAWLEAQPNNEAFCDSVSWQELEVDIATGKVVGGTDPTEGTVY